MYYISYLLLHSFDSLCCHLIRFNFQIVSRGYYFYIYVFVIDTGGSCYKIVAEYDRLHPSPSISAASKDKKGSNKILFLIIICIFKENKL